MMWPAKDVAATVIEDLLLSIRAETPTPESVEGYLVSQGWSVRARSPRWVELRRGTAPDEHIVEIPQLAHAPDYPRVVERVLTFLADIEGRPVEHVHRHICQTLIRHDRSAPTSR